MAYIKTSWLDRVVEHPNRYVLTDNGDGTYTISPSPGTITEAGTFLNAEKLNHIETGIETLEIDISAVNEDLTTLNESVDEHVGSGAEAHALATTSVAGFMSSDDKAKLDALPEYPQDTFTGSRATGGTWTLSADYSVYNVTYNVSNALTLEIEDGYHGQIVVFTLTSSYIGSITAGSNMLDAFTTGRSVYVFIEPLGKWVKI